MGIYHADTEDGTHEDDPSEDTLFSLIDDLYHPTNTFVIIEPEDEASDWFASVTLQDDGTYEMEWRDLSRGDHELTVETSRSHMARELIVWLSERHYPGSPVRDTGWFDRTL
jgi:hypothetical protein